MFYMRFQRREEILMTKNSVLSVIVPIYNSEKYLGQCIESILSQSMKNIVIILVDDGSTDKSGEICDSYARGSENICVIHKNNEGRILARKDGLKKVSTEYVGFVDADDWIEPDMYKTMIRLMDTQKVDMVDCAYNLFDESLKRIVKVVKDNIEPGRYKKDNEILRRFVSGDMIQAHWNRVYKTEIIGECMKNVPDDIAVGEDAICNFQYIGKIDSLYIDDDAFYNYRKHGEATTQRISENCLREINDYYQSYLKVIKQQCNQQDIIETFEHKVANMILDSLKRIGFSHPMNVLRYRVNAKKIRGTRIVVYGAGNVGRDIYNQLNYDSKIEVVLWTDSNWAELQKQNPELEEVEQINNRQFDTILIAVKDGLIADKIKISIMSKFGISSENIMWICPESCIRN